MHGMYANFFRARISPFSTSMEPKVGHVALPSLALPCFLVLLVNTLGSHVEGMVYWDQRG